MNELTNINRFSILAATVGAVAVSTQAQDKIALKNGTEIKTKVLDASGPTSITTHG